MPSQERAVLEYTLVTVNQIWENTDAWRLIDNMSGSRFLAAIPQKKWSFRRDGEGSAIFCCDSPRPFLPLEFVSNQSRGQT